MPPIRSTGVGYLGEAAFSRAFRRITGQPPSSVARAGAREVVGEVP